MNTEERIERIHELIQELDPLLADATANRRNIRILLFQFERLGGRIALNCPSYTQLQKQYFPTAQPRSVHKESFALWLELALKIKIGTYPWDTLKNIATTLSADDTNPIKRPVSSLDVIERLRSRWNELKRVSKTNYPDRQQIVNFFKKTMNKTTAQNQSLEVKELLAKLKELEEENRQLKTLTEGNIPLFTRAYITRIRYENEDLRNKNAELEYQLRTRNAA